LIRQNLDKELSVIEKIKERKAKQKEKKSFSLKNKDINKVLEDEIKSKKTNKIKIVTNKKNTTKKTETIDKKEKFLRDHYSLLENKKIKEAYENSAKKVSFKDYLTWYKNVKKIKINNIKKIKENTYLVDLNITDS
jgi:hypothetical protein